MADWYVDLSASSNGDGSTSSPWNQFTSTEAGSVNPGDKVWFRRCDANKYISGLVGGNASNKVYYIGWPKEGDDFYDSRDSGLAASWDNDSSGYTYLRRSVNSSSDGTLVCPSYCEVHRMFIYNSYNGHNAYSVYISGKQDILLKRCYVYSNGYSNSYNNNYSRYLYVYNSQNITIHTTTLRWTDNYYHIPQMGKISNSTVTFTNSHLYFSYNTSRVYTPSDLDWDTGASLYIESSSVVTINDCSLYNYYQASYSNNNGYYQTSCIYTYNSTLTISGCTINPNTYTDNYLLPGHPILPLVLTYSSDVTITDSTYNCNKMYALIDVYAYGTVTIKNITWNASSYPNALVFLSHNDFHITIDNITGSVAHSNVNDINGANYFIMSRYYHLLVNDRVQISNINLDHVYYLDIGRGTQYDITLSDSSGIVKECDMIFTRFSTITSEDNKRGTIIISDISDNSGYFIRGGLASHISVNSKSDTTNGTALQLLSNFNQTCNLTVNQCVCSGTSAPLLDIANSQSFFGTVKAIRNSGYTELGFTPAYPYVTLYSTFNNFDSGTTKYFNKYTYYETNIAKRSSGAGYSVMLSYINTTGDYHIQYPEVGYDTTWVYFASAGTYTVKAYVAYTTDDAETLTSSDIYLNVIVINDKPEEFSTSTLASDSSTWEDITGTPTLITLTNTVTTTQAQYAPVELHLTKNLTNLKVYLDPKLEVIVQ